MNMKILSRPKGNAEEYGRWSVNPYIGCSHGCLYCYLKKGPSGAYLGQDKPVLKKGIVNEEHAYHLAMAEIIENREEIIRDGGLFMTFTSDPCADETWALMFGIANSSSNACIPVTILTKRAFMVDGIEIEYSSPYRKLKSVQEFVAFGYTLTGHDEMEPRASTNYSRIVSMGRLHEDGFMVWASIEPVVDFHSSFNMIVQALGAGCQHFKIGLMTKNTKVCRGKYDHNDCLLFIRSVMRMVEAHDGTATVYWKQSFRDFLGDEDFARATIGYRNIVCKDWSIFNKED